MRPTERAVSLGIALWLTAVISIFCCRSLAQEQPPTTQGAATTSDAEWRQRMESRVKQLEDENRELRKDVNEVHDTQQSVMKDAESHGLITFESGEPHLTTPDFFDVNKFAAQGDWPGSFRIPGTKTSIQLGGYVQLDALFDSDRIGNKDSFVVNTIETGGPKTGAGDSNFSIRQTRLFLKTQTPTQNWGNLVTYIEIDFFGTDGAEPRVRHIYGQIGDKFQILTGQTFSAFQDATVFPATLDAQGPAGMVNSRRPQIRFRQQWSDEWATIESVEDPTSELTTPAGDAGEDATPYPDLDANVRWTPSWGHLQLAGVLRYLQFDPDVGHRESKVGYGFNFTGSVKTFRVDDKHIDAILFQFADGNGIARYINDTSGLGLDAVLPAPGASLDGLNALAGMIAYQHWWHPKWASTVCYSIVDITNSWAEPGSDYHSGQYIVVNLRFYPVDRVLLGGEVLYGVRENKDESKGDDVRMQFSAQYKF